MNNELISVIIPLYNNSKMIKNCVESVLKNDYPLFEVIIVDDGSTDDSLAVVREVEKRCSNLYVYSVSHGGQARARNFAIRKSVGAYIFFTDSDVIVPPDWISGIYRILWDKGVDVVGGGVQPYKLSNIYEEAEHRRYQFLGDRGCYTQYVFTCNMAVRKDILEEVGMFDESFVVSCEDVDLGLRISSLGYKIWFAPERSVLHIHPEGLGGVVRRAMFYGYEISRARIKNGYAAKKEFSGIAKSAKSGFQEALRIFAGKRIPHVPFRAQWVVLVYEGVYLLSRVAGFIFNRRKRSLPQKYSLNKNTPKKPICC